MTQGTSPIPYYAAAAPEPAQFLDVPVLLESSLPRQRVPRLWLFLGGFLLVAMFSTMLGGQSARMRGLVEVLSALAMFALLVTLGVTTFVTVRRFRAEQQEVESAGEMVQLRRWPEAAGMLERILLRPSRTMSLRTQALVYVTAVLSRYERFADAIAVHDHLLEHKLVDPAGSYGLRLGRAMAMLREDHLVDADRALSELRRLTPSDADSAGLALIEIYRDVKTGHPDEAIEIFQRKQSALRDQLGHRAADAYVLVARAYDLLGRAAEAQAMFDRATLLAPPPELFRRYPEVRPLQDRYQPALAPAEAA